MARRWQLRTWTKGTGAAVEPFGATDAPQARAQPGRLRPMPPKGTGQRRSAPAAGAHLTTPVARRRHALRYMDARTTEALEALEERLLVEGAAAAD